MANYYENINEMPIYNWEKFIETNDYNYFLKSVNIENIEMPDVFENISKQIINEFGLNFSLKHKLELRRKIIYYSLLELTDKRYKTHSNKYKKELETFLKDSQENKQSLTYTATMLSAFFKYRIDIMTVSIAEYYNLLKIYEQTQTNESNKKH